MYLSTEFVLPDADHPAELSVKPLSAQDAMVARLTQWWAVHALGPFLREPSGVRLSPMIVRRAFLGSDVTFTVRFDARLLEDLLDAYAAHGWAALKQVDEIVASLPKVYRPNLLLLRAACRVVAVIVAQGLVDIENLAIQFARDRWQGTRTTLSGWLRAFRVTTINLDHPALVDRTLADNLLAGCRRYGLLRTRVLELQAEIDARNRKTPPSRRPPGSGYALWFEVYASQQRELLHQMTAELARISAMFPPTVLVLDDLPSEVFDDTSVVRIAKASVALEGLIHSRITDLAARTDQLLLSLDSTPGTAEIGTILEMLAADPSSIARIKLPDEGFEARILELVLGRTGVSDQRVLADLQLMIALTDDSDSVAPGTFNRVILYRYVLALTEETDSRRRISQWWDDFWGWIERITAGLTLVALMLVFPFDSPSVGPALVALLRLAGAAASVIGVVTLLLHHLLGSLQQAGSLDRVASDRLFRLGQDDPDALAEISEALARSAALRRAVETGALIAVLTIGASHRIKAVSVALSFQEFADDVETLFGPVRLQDEHAASADG